MWDRIGENQVYVRQQKAAEEQLRFDKTEKPSCLASKDTGGSVPQYGLRSAPAASVQSSRVRFRYVSLTRLSTSSVIRPEPPELAATRPWKSTGARRASFLQ